MTNDLMEELRIMANEHDDELCRYALDRFALLEEAIDQYRKALSQSSSRIEALEAVLRFYADEENWRGKFIYEQPGVIRHEGGFIRGDKGKIARAALGEKKDD